jgi:hypothetical protein
MHSSPRHQATKVASYVEFWRFRIDHVRNEETNQCQPNRKPEPLVAGSKYTAGAWVCKGFFAKEIIMLTIDVGSPKGFCEQGEWICSHTFKLCPFGTSCDPADGDCKQDDLLVPCITVIDEDDSFGNPTQEELWNEFRRLYPTRPFCLLNPIPSYGGLSIPSNFANDDYTTTFLNIRRDNGDVALAEDWAAMCGFDYYGESHVGFVGLFVDDSGSMTKSEVMASYTLFLNKMSALGIQVKEVTNSNENWILPFLTTLAPLPQCITGDGQGGHCMDVNDCTTNAVPWAEGDPEPNCYEYPTNIQCCIDI